MNIKPLQDWVVVTPDEAREQSQGGIIIPDTAKERPEQGKVVAVGEGRWIEEKTEGKKTAKEKEKKFVPMTLKPGDHIFYEKYAARRMDINNEEWVLVREADVLGCR
jgi:chaperonin GroES